MRRVLTAIAATAAVTAASPATAQVNCTTDRGRAEQLICANSHLYNADLTMANLYFRLRDNLNRPGAQTLLDNQRHWLADRNGCASVGCLERIYSDRIRALRRILD